MRDSLDNLEYGHEYRSGGTGHWIRYNNRRNGSCPICGLYKSRCGQSPTGVQHCVTAQHGDVVPGYRNIGNERTGLDCSQWVEGDPFVPYTDEDKKEWGRRKRDADRQAEKERVARQVRAKLPSQLNKEYQQQFDRNPISVEGQSEFTKRGLCDGDIACIGAYTIGSKLYLPIPNLDGLRVGAQVKVLSKPGYIWDRAGDNHTKNHDELPIAVYGNRNNPGRILFVEGTGFKPYITSKRFAGDLVIGASGGQFGTVPKQIREVLTKYPNASLVLYPDAGATLNRNVQSQYDRLFELAGDRNISIAWWQQFIKPDGDIDEIGTSAPIEYLEVARYKSIAADGCGYTQLTTIDEVGAIERNEQFLSPLTLPELSSINFVSSGVGTGKTHQLPAILNAWQKLYPDGRIIVLGYRNALIDQMSDRLKIDSYRVGYGQDDEAISSIKRLAIVADSITRLNLTDIPANTLLIIDEVEAVLKHCAIAGTFGGRAGSTQSHIANILDRVLVSRGAIVALEDTITRISVKGLGDLTGGKYASSTVINRYNRFQWDVSIGHKSPHKFKELIISRLMAGERIQLSTTSQKFGEGLHRMIVKRLPELEGKIQRVDAKTITEKKDLVGNPIEFLRANETRLLIISPTVESGFSIDDGGDNPLFDRVVLYAANLDTRTQLQMLARYRSNCPRDIFVSKRGAESSGEVGRNSAKLLKKYKTIASKTALEQGYGTIKNSKIGEVWNRLECEFKARDAISAKYLYQFLRKELIEDGHNLSPIDWEVECDRYQAEHKIEITGDIETEYKEEIEQIDRELTTALYVAKEPASKMNIGIADKILHSSSTTYKQKVEATMCKHLHRLPGITEQMGEEFIYDCLVTNRGRYVGECHLAYLVGRPPLARAIDRDIFAKQAEQPHLIYSRVPKNSQRARVLSQIADGIEDLATGREYKEGDVSVTRIANFARSKAYEMWELFGLNPIESGTDSEGKRINTDIAIVNKLMAKLGYKGKRIKQLGTGKDRTSVYSIVNANCAHRQLIYEALEKRYRLTIENANQIELVAHAISNPINPVLKNACVDSSNPVESAFFMGFSHSELDEIADQINYIARNQEYAHLLKNEYPIDVLRKAGSHLDDSLKKQLGID